jgi:hypothetical protein
MESLSQHQDAPPSVRKADPPCQTLAKRFSPRDFRQEIFQGDKKGKAGKQELTGINSRKTGAKAAIIDIRFVGCAGQ